MNIRFKNIILPALLATAISSCTLEDGNESSTQFDILVNANVESPYESDTRVVLYNSADEVTEKTFLLYGWEGNYEDVLFTESATVYDSGQWKTESTQKIMKNGNYKFYAYSKVPDTVSGISASVTDAGVSVEVTDITKSQEDILLGQGSIESASSGNVNMNFSHPLASVIFKVGTIDNLNEVTEVSLSGLAKNGSTSLSESSSKDGNDITKYTWSDSESYTSKLTVTGLKAKAGDTASIFVVIPQDLATNNSAMIVKYTKTDNTTGFITKIFKTGEWKAGYTTIYTIGFKK